MQPPYSVWVPQTHTPWNGGYISDIWDISSFDTNNQDTIIHNNSINTHAHKPKITPTYPNPTTLVTLSPPNSNHNNNKPPYTSLIVTGMVGVGVGRGGTCRHRESVIDPQCITPNLYRRSQRYYSHPKHLNFLKLTLLPFKNVIFFPSNR